MYLVTKSRKRENQLGYDPKSGEYVYLRKGREIWREKGDKKLLDAFVDVNAGLRCIDEDIENDPIFEKYCESCLQF